MQTKKPASKSPVISSFIVMGDSLSDRGTMNDRELMGCIPMSYFTGLYNTSPEGSFTNGFAWTDHFFALVSTQFIIWELQSTDLIHTLVKKQLLDPEDVKKFQKFCGTDPTDIADALISGNKLLLKILNAYHLDKDKEIQYRKANFARTYCEGGLTSHDYSWKLSTSPTRFFTRLVVSTLKAMRHELLVDDHLKKISAKKKSETLVIEWSGANDLATVNERPSIKEVDRAIAARMENIEQLTLQGYRHFILFDLPDMSLTPRFQGFSAHKRKHAQACSQYFNQELENGIDVLRQKYPYATFDIFRVSTIMSDAYANPEKYGLDKDKLNIPYIKSKDFKMQENGTSPAKGYMFWDDVHPSADVHAWLAQRFYGKFQMKFAFTLPIVDEEVRDTIKISMI